MSSVSSQENQKKNDSPPPQKACVRKETNRRLRVDLGLGNELSDVVDDDGHLSTGKIS